MIRAFAYILLFIHINTTMFVPVTDERDVFDKSGRQINDINTSLEFVDQIILGNTDVTRIDADDDQAHFFTGIIGISCYIANQQEVTVTRKDPSTRELAVAYPLLPEQKTLSIAYDIITPPPQV